MKASLLPRMLAMLVGCQLAASAARANPIDEAMAKARTLSEDQKKEFAWTAEKAKRDKAGITAKTAKANAHLAEPGRDKGSKLLAAHRSHMVLPKNDGLLYTVGKQTYHFRNCALDTLAAIEGGASTSTRAAVTWQKIHSDEALKGSATFELVPGLQYEQLFIIVEVNLHPKYRKESKKGLVKNTPMAPPSGYFGDDRAIENRKTTQAQLKGMIEYLLYLRKQSVAYAKGVSFIISQQGYPDLLPSDPDRTEHDPGDDLGDLYDLSDDPGKNRLLQLMRSYPNGTRYAVFLYGKGRGIGDQHWLYAEKYNDRVVFRDFQKSLKVSDTEAWEPTSYLEETPLTPVDNHAGVFTKGMFFAYVPVFSGESSKTIEKALTEAAETLKAQPPLFHETVPTEWKVRAVEIPRKVSEPMLGVINASIPALLKRIGLSVATAPPKLEWNKNYFELDSPKFGLAMLFCENASKGPGDDVIYKSIYASAAKAGVKLGADTKLKSLLTGASDKRETTARVLRYLFDTPELFGKILPEMKKNADLGVLTLLPAAKRCASITEAGKQAVYMHARNGQTAENFFYTALHEYMHLTSGSAEGLMDWKPPALAKVADTDLFNLKNNLNEGFTDLFADLAACYVRKNKATSMPGLVPPEDEGMRAYTYLRRAVMLMAERLETVAATPPNPLLQGVKALAAIYFKADWASFDRQIKTDATRPNPAFFGHVKDLSLYPTGYKSGAGAAAIKALGLPIIADLKKTRDPGVQLCTDIWGFTAPPPDCASLLDGAEAGSIDSSLKGTFECLGDL